MLLISRQWLRSDPRLLLNIIFMHKFIQTEDGKLILIRKILKKALFSYQ